MTVPPVMVGLAAAAGGAVVSLGVGRRRHRDGRAAVMAPVVLVTKVTA